MVEVLSHCAPKAMSARRFRATAGHAIGILVIDIAYPLAPGNVANASTFPFPVLYKILEGVKPEKLLAGDPEILEVLLTGGRELIARGARTIVGACGSFAYFQKAAAQALGVPTYLSIMTLVPLILQSLRSDQKLGVIAADARAITPRVLDQCNVVARDRLAYASAIDAPEFAKLLTAPEAFSSDVCESEIAALAERFVAENPELGAILLQCSDLPPYAASIQKVTGLPVYDMSLLVEWLQSTLVRRPYHGFM